MVRRHDRAEILAAVLDVVGEAGLAALTYRRVADRLGIPDRTVVYYFPSKHSLIAGALQAHAVRLKELLTGALGDGRLRPSDALERAWAALQTDQADTAIRVYLEVVGLSASGRSPYRELSAAVAAEWTTWFTEHLTGPVETRPQVAAALLAQLDGLLLLRHTGGPGLAGSAAVGLGLRPGPAALPVTADPAGAGPTDGGR